jgi:1-acyl-sn-glycerol-3-phosphate acyltransferase
MLPAWPRTSWASLARWFLQHLLLFPLLRVLCRPMVVEGIERLPAAGPVLFVANHSSHADTAVILRALPSRLRRRVAPAAAADHFYRRRVIGAAVSLLVGAFPFPRHGGEGLARARQLMAEGWSVLLFPQGSRAGGTFRPGAALLASDGTPVVPVGINGTAWILPKGRRVPRPGPVCLRFGEIVRYPRRSDPWIVRADLERRVDILAAIPMTAGKRPVGLPEPRRSINRRGSRWGLPDPWVAGFAGTRS